MAALVLGATALSCTVHGWADAHVRRTAAFAEYDGRPPSGKGTNWLIVGTDSRSGLSAADTRRLRTGRNAGARTDTVMLVHFGARGTELLSIPRDSYVHVPAYTDSTGVRHRAERNKINTAYGRGGPRLLTRTLEQETGLRLDHYAEIDFAGFVRLVDALGGVHNCLEGPVRDSFSGAALPGGCQTLDGREALAYVRARHFDPEGDLGRVRRQQRFLSALARRVAEPGIMLNPSRLAPLMDATIVDGSADATELAELAVRLERAASMRGALHTVPIADPGYDAGGVGEVVLWDRRRARAVFEALREDGPLPEYTGVRNGNGSAR